MQEDRDSGRRSPPELLRSLSSALCVPLTGRNRITALRNGIEIFPPMLAAIESARDTVNFLTYVYWRGEIASQFADALAAAAARGVEVRVLIDAVGGARMKERWVRQMRDAGCRVAFFNPLHRGIRKNNWRTHRKVLVVDGRVGYTGGVGVGEEWTGDAQDADHWRDDHFEVSGPVVPYLQGAFVDNWHLETGEMLSGERFYPGLPSPSRDGAGAWVMPIFGRPGADPSGLALSYRLLLRQAEKSIDLATPYFVPDEEALDSLREARRRGVRIRVLTPGEHNDSRLAQWASEGLLPQVVEAGVEAYRYQPTMIHSKIMVVDGRLAVVGSANFDCRSFQLNHELNLIVEHEGFAGHLTRNFERDLERSQRVSPEDFENLSVFRRTRNRIALLFRSQL